MDNRLVNIQVSNKDWNLNILNAKLEITSPTGTKISVYKKSLLIKPDYAFLVNFLSNFNGSLIVSVETLINLKNFKQC
jgi:hypothetical protein